VAEGTHQRFVGRLASTLARLHQIDDLPARLSEAGRQMLRADGATITLWASAEARLRVSATDELAVLLEDLQDVVEQGPSVDALATGGVVIVRFDDESDDRWSLMRQHGARLGFAGTLIAVPLVVDGRVIGVLSAHRQEPETAEDREVGEFLGATLATALLQDNELGLGLRVESPDWPSRAQVHRATGMIVAQAAVLPEDALALLKGQAFAQGATLNEIADQIVQKRINFRHFTIEGD
jgi:transcriptional regulator with GAF, ATPase, and Fis domain